ncbi:hypothetical protein l11_18440 [Neisseria weaveri LMG 5135]|nr:hypothetical protein l11_18440 [Neisseria weaveri LMG 5135]EGV37550.1 hypothetical protein l13_03450 [Neisseria weaveri ATCC 51223]
MMKRPSEFSDGFFFRRPVQVNQLQSKRMLRFDWRKPFALKNR